MDSGTDGKAYISDGNPNILTTDRNDDGRQVNAYYDNPDNNWNDNGAFAVPVAPLSSFLLSLVGGVLFTASFVEVFCELSVPTAKHPAYLINLYRNSQIFLVIERFGFPENHKKNFYCINFADSQPYIGLFFCRCEKAGDSNGFNCFDTEGINTLT